MTLRPSKSDHRMVALAPEPVSSASSSAHKDPAKSVVQIPSTTTTTATTLVVSTGVVLRNAARFGASDVLPRDPIYSALSPYDELARELAWGNPPDAHVEEVELPLGPLAARIVHDVDAISYLRFGGAIIDAGSEIESCRVSAHYATAVRFEPTGNRLFAVGGRSLFDARCKSLADRFPLLLQTDVAVFFPSIRADVLDGALRRAAGPSKAERILHELHRIGTHGLPVGGAPQRLLGEIMLNVVDQRLRGMRRDFVRQMDDLCIGVRSEKDADDVLSEVQEALNELGLSLNKAKTRLLHRGDITSCAMRQESLSGVFEGVPDRVVLTATLRHLTERSSSGLVRSVKRDLGILLDNFEKCVTALPAWTKATTRLLGLVTDAGPVLEECRIKLLGARHPVSRAHLVQMLVRMRDPQVAPTLETLALGDRSSLVRRAAIIGLGRLGRVEAVRRLVRTPTRPMDRNALVLVAAALDIECEPAHAVESLLMKAGAALGRKAMW